MCYSELSYSTRVYTDRSAFKIVSVNDFVEQKNARFVFRVLTSFDFRQNVCRQRLIVRKGKRHGRVYKRHRIDSERGSDATRFKIVEIETLLTR